jgi:hypothetical protein
MRNEHPELWEKWCLDFVRLYNDGLSSRQIMRRYQDKNNKLLFSWTVIEKNMRRVIEKGKATLSVRKRSADELKKMN